MFEPKDKINFLVQIFGKGTLDGRQKNLTVECPNQNCQSRLKSKKKFAIHIENDFSHCWVCSLRFKNLIPVLQRYFGGKHIKEYLDKFSNENLVIFDDDEEESAEVELPEDYVFLASEKKPNSNLIINKAFNYLKKRNITEKDFWLYKIGYSDADPKFKKRIIFPSFDKNGNLNYVVGRSVFKNSFRKYNNSYVPKNSIIFNEYLIDFNKTLCITEGIFDAIKSGPNSVPILGSFVHEESLLFYKILKHRTNIVLGLDSDMVDKSQKLAKKFYEYDIPVKIATLPDKKDFGDLTKQEARSILDKSKTWNKDNQLREKLKRISL